MENISPETGESTKAREVTTMSEKFYEMDCIVDACCNVEDTLGAVPS